MIEIFESTSVRATSTVQDLLNDLGSVWEWKKVEKDGDNITKLWASDKIYIDLTSDSTPKIRVTHSVNGYTTNFSSTPSIYTIVKTDEAVMVIPSGTDVYYFVIDKTVDSSDVISSGVIVGNAANNAMFYTDTMSAATQATLNNIAQSSVYYTQLVPIYSHCGTEHFANTYLLRLKKASDSGKVLLNDKKFYVYNNIAVAYTA